MDEPGRIDSCDFPSLSAKIMVDIPIQAHQTANSPVEPNEGEKEGIGNEHSDYTAHRRHSHRNSRKSILHLPDIRLDPSWVRSFDQNLNIYYYNTMSGVSAWLAPCSYCLKPADKWCVDCCRSYCDHDFTKRHDKHHMRKHKWQLKEVPPPVTLHPDEEYCIACQRKAAFKMCLDCCDAYCLACFSLVHHVGALKLHKAMPMNRYKMGWMTVRNHEQRTDTYLHGATGETSDDKPIELLTEWETLTLENIKSHKEAAQAHLATLEKLRAELVVVMKERDRAVVETSKTISELRAKAAAKEKSDEAASAKLKKDKSRKF